MGHYILKRFLWFIPVIILIAITIFSLLYITPGDPAQQILGSNATSAQIAEQREVMGLDRPFIVQLLDYLKDLFLRFDLGTSYLKKTDVASAILTRLPYTLRIASFTCLIQLLIAIPLGNIAATHQNGFMDRFSIIMAMLGTSIPNFIFAILLIQLFSVQLHWLPSYGVANWTGYILPCFSGAVMGIAAMTRQTRSQMLEVISSDYCTTARAKGISEQRILVSHALPNALIPVITSAGQFFGMALGGTVIIESVFAIPGLGLYLVEAIAQRDYPVIRGSVVVLAILFSVVMLVVDLIYAYVDPRIKAGYQNQHKRRAKREKA